MDEISEFKVLVNDEEQHSIWPAEKDAPEGWRQVGSVGDKETCVAFIEATWTDITPLSVRATRH